MVAINCAARRVDKSFDVVVARGHQHVQKAAHIAGIGVQRVFDGTRHRTQRGLMQNQIHAPAGALTEFEVADVTLNEFEIPPPRWPDQLPYFPKVPFFAGLKIVHPDDVLVELEKGLNDVRADKPRGASDEPGFGPPRHFGSQFFVGRHLNGTRSFQAVLVLPRVQSVQTRPHPSAGCNCDRGCGLRVRLVYVRPTAAGHTSSPSIRSGFWRQPIANSTVPNVRAKECKQMGIIQGRKIEFVRHRAPPSTESNTFLVSLPTAPLRMRHCQPGRILAPYRAAKSASRH